MKKNIITLMLLFNVFLVFAQEFKGFVSVNIGPGIPLNDFGSKNRDNEDAGFAKTGAVFEFNFGHILGGNNFGVLVSLRGQANNIDTEESLSILRFEAPSINWSYKANPYQTSAFLTGVYGAVLVSENVFFNQKP